jgi:hypothetical protein
VDGWREVSFFYFFFPVMVLNKHILHSFVSQSPSLFPPLFAFSLLPTTKFSWLGWDLEFLILVVASFRFSWRISDKNFHNQKESLGGSTLDHNSVASLVDSGEVVLF